jgi:YD repeat-containing protein
VVTYSVGGSPEMQTAPLRFGYDRLRRRNTIKTYLPGTNATWILSLPSPPPVSTLSQIDNDLGEPQQVLNQPSAAGQPAERHAYNAAQQRIRDELADGSSWNWEFDPLGRRIGRIISTGASGSWVPTSTTRWLYEGWNPVAELNGAGTLVREYVRGTDLSRSGPHGRRQSLPLEYEDPG